MTRPTGKPDSETLWELFRLEQEVMRRPNDRAAKAAVFAFMKEHGLYNEFDINDVDPPSKLDAPTGGDPK